jgi:hypothetical protein
MASDWYLQRLRTKQNKDIRLWERHVQYLEAYAVRASHQDLVARFGITARLKQARAHLDEVRGKRYLESLRGTLGADPLGTFTPD